MIYAAAGAVAGCLLLIFVNLWWWSRENRRDADTWFAEAQARHDAMNRRIAEMRAEVDRVVAESVASARREHRVEAGAEREVGGHEGETEHDEVDRPESDLEERQNEHEQGNESKHGR